MIEATMFRPTACAMVVRPPFTVELAHAIMQLHAHWRGFPCPLRRAALDYLVRSGHCVIDTRRRHVRATFLRLGMTLDYQCDLEAARRFAAEAGTRDDLDITVDLDVHPDMAPLPCSRLWTVG